MLARNSKRRLSGIIALAAVTALLAPSAARLNAAGGESAQEGIKVHGDWTIEIRDPDGTLVTRREFKNSLSGITGPSFLAELLNASIAVTAWLVQISGSPGPCTEAIHGAAVPCLIATPTDVGRGTHVPKTLVVMLTGDGQGLELSGTTTAARASSIYKVNTLVTRNTNVSSALSFTEKQLASPILVAEGQIIQVKVVLSFS